MKINRLQWDKLKPQWDILKMKSAYIEAEKSIVQDPSLTAWQDEMANNIKAVGPEEFWREFQGGLVDLNKTPGYVEDAKSTERMLIREQILEIEEQGRKLLKEEKYELLQEAKEIWEKLQQQLKNLK